MQINSRNDGKSLLETTHENYQIFTQFRTSFIDSFDSFVVQKKKMNLSVEISMYPLNQEYGTPILQFIERLKSYKELEIRSNTMSTQVFGEYGMVMDVIKEEMKTAFLTEDAVVMVMKFINKDLK